MFVEEMVELPAPTAHPLVTIAFDNRTILEMETALTKACETLSRCLDSHETRCVIAKRILRRVNDGERTFGGMAAAGMAAVEELRRRHQQV
ncbi:hypothetical protein [Tardiphaga robiniae]|uniref:Uncharacterized protein n=1 Tax=Tardiphaga robiniae TaxID=943830 RepID=A0A7G6TSW4_9BRAD|nr:hypothetical protein [Tardiphaga robiniae]QND69846.1 hypothetical protein HB776_00245 [Tardiphaga robiniae]